MRMWNNALIPFVDRSSAEIMVHLYKRPAFPMHRIQYPKTQFQLEHIGHYAHDKPMGSHRHLENGFWFLLATVQKIEDDQFQFTV